MANNVIFEMFSGPPVTISKMNPGIEKELSMSTVKWITVRGDPWVFFDSPNYGGNFVIYEEGKNQPFPRDLTGNIIKSLRLIKGRINSSQVTLYPHPFFEGTGDSFQSETPQLEDKYLSLKVDVGAVVFFNEGNYGGEKRILLNGDEVENFTA
ncbi:beta-crystallin B2-like, partial [Macrochelys suwanniensis]